MQLLESSLISHNIMYDIHEKFIAEILWILEAVSPFGFVYKRGYGSKSYT